MGDLNESIVYTSDNNVEFRVNLEVRVNDKGQVHNDETNSHYDEEGKQIVANGNESIHSENQNGLLIEDGVCNENKIENDVDVKSSEINETGEACSENNDQVQNHPPENEPEVVDVNGCSENASEKDFKVTNGSYTSTQSLQNSIANETASVKNMSNNSENVCKNEPIEENTALTDESVPNIEGNVSLVNASELIVDGGHCDAITVDNNDVINPETVHTAENEEIVVSIEDEGIKIDEDLIYDDFLVLSKDHINIEPTKSDSLDILNEYADIDISELNSSSANAEKDETGVTAAVVAPSETTPNGTANTAETKDVKEIADTEEVKNENTETSAAAETTTVKASGSQTSIHSKTGSIGKKSSNCFCIGSVPREKFKFPSNNNIIITLRYNETSKDLLGNIRSLKGLGFDEKQPKCPIYIRFHILVLPQCKYKLKTKWVHASLRSLAWKFYLGPFKEEDFDPAKKNIRFRLYGKSKVVSRCYGECFVPLLEVAEAEGSIEFERDILGKGVLKGMNVKSRR